MHEGWWVGGIVGVALLAGGAWLLRRSDSRSPTQQAIDLFRLRRESLEAKFFELAAASGKPRGLRWVRCDWLPEVDFARDLQTGLLTAFVAVQIHFEAVEGSDMEELEAVGYFREASAAFHYQNGNWGTGGKTLNNLHPREAVDRLVGQYERVQA